MSGWVDACALSDLEPKWVTQVSIEGRAVAIYDTPSGLYATHARCTHGGASLGDGYFDGHTIECPLHQGAFDVRNGQVVSAPASRPLRCVEVRKNGGRVEVRLR